ncbi:hypothetical protein DTO271D3_4098 [Paecilomyces variotii]|nr:hypothetical protein DTO169C6_2707 [Paecilomyces variotii]KAJ9315525.1 hypothetical protein DTO271D3_4098 [Paecilomyces variotii]
MEDAHERSFLSFFIFFAKWASMFPYHTIAALADGSKGGSYIVYHIYASEDVNASRIEMTGDACRFLGVLSVGLFVCQRPDPGCRLYIQRLQDRNVAFRRLSCMRHDTEYLYRHANGRSFPAHGRIHAECIRLID